MEGMRVLLVDDHSLVRAGIRALLGSIAGVAGIEEASSGRQAVALAATMQPDLVLMDIAMDDMDGLAATRAISAAHPHIKVVILSMHDTGDFFEQALRRGAAIGPAGFVADVARSSGRDLTPRPRGRPPKPRDG